MIPRRKLRFYKGIYKDLLLSAGSRAKKSGVNVEGFESKFAGYIGVQHAVATCSGRHAMELIIDGFGLVPGDEIIMASYTLKDLVLLIESKGLSVNLIDIKDDSYNIDPELIEKNLTSKTKMIIATHIFGLPCELGRIMEIAKKHNLFVVEDCAHAAGAMYEDKKVGSIADAGFFSMERQKLLNTFGGGMITSNNESVYRYAKENIEALPENSKIYSKIMLTLFEHFVYSSPLCGLISFLFASEWATKFLSFLYLRMQKGARGGYTKFTELQAEIGIKQLDDLDELNGKRSEIAERLMAELAGVVTLQEHKGSERYRRVYYYLVGNPSLELINLSHIRMKLVLMGVDAGIESEITDNCFEKEGSVTNRLYNSNIQIPLYDDLNKSAHLKIGKALKKTVLASSS